MAHFWLCWFLIIGRVLHWNKVLKATDKKAKTGVWEKNGYWFMNNGGVRVENILHEGAYSSTNYEAIWRSSFLIRSYICEFHDLRLLVWTFGSSSMRTCQKQFILSYLSWFTVSWEFMNWKRKKKWKFLFSSFQKTAAPDSFTIEWRRRFVILYICMKNPSNSQWKTLPINFFNAKKNQRKIAFLIFFSLCENMWTGYGRYT